jgi:flagellar motility protein MotE (MotC chaperone)
MRFRPRLLPAVLFAGALVLTIRVGDLWSELSVTAGSRTAAETVKDPAPPVKVADAAEPEADSGAAPGEEAAAESAAIDGRADPFSYTDEEVEVLQALSKRRDELAARERKLQQRAALLAAAEQRVDKKVEDLKALQSTIEGLVKQYDAQEKKKFEGLVKIYENMKPKDAARIFEQLEMDVLLEVVGRMREQKAAKILAEMNPEKAMEVTLELAQQAQLPVPR